MDLDSVHVQLDGITTTLQLVLEGIGRDCANGKGLERNVVKRLQNVYTPSLYFVFNGLFALLGDMEKAIAQKSGPAGAGTPNEAEVEL